MQIEKIFDVIGCIEVQKVSFAIFMQNGDVEHWWRATKETLPFGEGEPLTWVFSLKLFTITTFYKVFAMRTRWSSWNWYRETRWSYIIRSNS